MIASTFASEHELLAAAVREQLRLAVTLAFYAGLTEQDRGQLGAKLAQAFGG